MRQLARSLLVLTLAAWAAGGTARGATLGTGEERVPLLGTPSLPRDPRPPLAALAAQKAELESKLSLSEAAYRQLAVRNAQANRELAQTQASLKTTREELATAKNTAIVADRQLDEAIFEKRICGFAALVVALGFCLLLVINRRTNRFPNR